MKKKGGIAEVTMTTYLNDNLARIGRTIAERRKALGLSVRELGARTGVNYTTLSLIENGKLNASIATLTKIIDEIGLKIEIK